MDFKGKVIQKLDLESGTSARTGATWSKQSWILETDGQYPRKVKVDAMGRALENVHMEVGKTYTVSVDAESREYNSRWYTDLRVYRAVEEQDGNAAFGGGQPAQMPQQPASPFASTPTGFPPAPEAPAFTDSPDDLPF
ncbi:MAG: DUF3127 domain-containing protein [Muribaculaceae bacterium]|nr:DUF3127 domain-containing protein [Muribaculaceae bacterium]